MSDSGVLLFIEISVELHFIRSTLRKFIEQQANRSLVDCLLFIKEKQS